MVIVKFICGLIGIVFFSPFYIIGFLAGWLAEGILTGYQDGRERFLKSVDSYIFWLKYKKRKG